MSAQLQRNKNVDALHTLLLILSLLGILKLFQNIFYTFELIRQLSVESRTTISDYQGKPLLVEREISLTNGDLVNEVLQNSGTMITFFENFN